MPRTATKTRPAAETRTLTEQEPLWNVIVWNDPVNLMNYVVLVFQRVFGYSRELATKLMLEVHNAGRSLVASEPREQAEMHVTQLHQHGLQATMQKQDG
jgi:ATP-dependent Clp protease adaptor protein ClpS